MPALVGYIFDTVRGQGFIYSCLGDSILMAGTCAVAMTFLSVITKDGRRVRVRKIPQGSVLEASQKEG